MRFELLESRDLLDASLVENFKSAPTVAMQGTHLEASNLTVFHHHTPEYGAEPWVSDGTADGTRVLLDLNPGLGSSSPRHFLPHAGNVFFVASVAPRSSDSLWVTDGTPEGTIELLRLRPEQTISPTIQSAGMVVFAVETPLPSGGNQQELWQTDGTQAGTQPIQGTMLQRTSDPAVNGLVGAGRFPPTLMQQDGVVYVAFHGHIWSWSEDEGTNLIQEQASIAFAADSEESPWIVTARQMPAKGPQPSRDNTLDVWRLSGHDLLLVGTLRNVTLFRQAAVVNGLLNVQIVTPMRTPEVYSFSRHPGEPQLVTIDGNSNFVFEGATDDQLVLRTPQNQLLAVAQNGAVSPLSSPDWLAFAGETIYTFDRDESPSMLTSFEPSVGMADIAEFPGRFVAAARGLESSLIFLTENDATTQLWISDATIEGTRPIWERDIFQRQIQSTSPGASGVLISTPDHLYSGGRNLSEYKEEGARFLHGFDGIATNYWSTQDKIIVLEEADDTIRIWAMTHGADSLKLVSEFASRVPQDAHVVLNDKVLFAHSGSDDASTELWVTDGTFEGTKRLLQEVSGNAGFTVVGEEVFFRNQSESGSDWAIWKSDGTVEGTQEILPLNNADPASWTALETKLIGLESNTLFAFDTADVDAQPFRSSFPATTHQLFSMGEFLTFHTHDGGNSQIRRTDGTEAGTRQYGILPAVYYYETSLNGKLLITGETAGTFGLWEADGTPGGLQLIRWIGEGTAMPFVESPTDGLAYFVFENERHGRELWVTDGTALGTHVYDIKPGEASGLSSNSDFVVWQDELYILSNARLWKIDSSLPVVGDLDRDGQVGFADFLVLSDNFGENSDLGVERGDLNGDRMVDFADFLALSDNFGQKSPPPIQFQLNAPLEPGNVDEIVAEL